MLSTRPASARRAETGGSMGSGIGPDSGTGTGIAAPVPVVGGGSRHRGNNDVSVAGRASLIRLLDDKAEALGKQGLYRDQIDRLVDALETAMMIIQRDDPKLLFRTDTLLSLCNLYVKGRREKKKKKKKKKRARIISFALFSTFFFFFFFLFPPCTFHTTHCIL
jgi:hypothetical protein